MKNCQFKRPFLFLAISILLSGCKINQDVAQTTPEVSGVGGITPSAPRNYTALELEVGRRICSHLKSKREFFETLTNEKEQFKFKAELRNCDNGLYNNAFFVASISNANSTEPEYVANRENYFRDVTTDQSGVMKTLCESMNQSDVVSNNILSSNFKYTINVLIANGYDTYQIVKAKKNTAGTYETLSSESVSLISNSNQAAAKFLGVEKDRVRYTLCDGKKFQTVRQTWIEALTNF